MTMPIGALGSIVIDDTVTFSGGEATEGGGFVVWSHYALTHWSEAGTWQCQGVRLCGLIGVPDGTVLPIATLAIIAGTTAYDPIYLGLWSLDPTHSAITASTRAVNQVGGPTVSPPLAPGQPAQWFVFGAYDICCDQSPDSSFPFPMPQPPYPTDIADPAEPGTGALALLGAAALAYALRARRAA